MPDLQPPQPRIDADPKVRTLKIEADGSCSEGYKPKIRIRGRWLERAGFPPGLRVQVTRIAHGVIELRSPDAENPQSALPPSMEKVEVPF